MSTCSRCGATLREGAKFCLACGEPAPAARLSAADFLSGSVQPPSRGPAPAAVPPAEPPAAGWASPPAVPAVQRAALPESPQPAAWPAPVQPEAAQRHDAAPERGVAAAVPAAPPSAGELERALARTKSYIGPAVLVFFLYTLLYIPGLIINRMYLTEAHEMEQIAGRKLPGTGCLTTLLWLGILPAIILVVLIIAFLGGSLGRLF